MGGVIGGFILLALLALCIVPIIHRKRQARIREYHDKDDLPQFRPFTLTGTPAAEQPPLRGPETYEPYPQAAAAPPSAFVARPFIVPPVATAQQRPRKAHEDLPVSPVSRATSEYGSGGRAGSVRRLSESLTRTQLDQVRGMAARGVQGKEVVDAIENMIRDNYRTRTGVDDDEQLGPPQYDVDDDERSNSRSRRS